MSDILNNVEIYCREMLSGEKCSRLSFHNLTHTQEVVNNVYEITKKLNLPILDLENVLIAAWFHDTGFAEDYKDHEKCSKRIAEEFLNKQFLEQQRVDIILTCIEVTKLGSKPVSMLEKIMCDADLYHLSKCDYLFRNILLRKEWEKELGVFYSDNEWYKLNYKFLNEHKFYINQNNQNLNSKLKTNINKLRKLIDKSKV